VIFDSHTCSFDRLSELLAAQVIPAPGCAGSAPGSSDNTPQSKDSLGASRETPAFEGSLRQVYGLRCLGLQNMQGRLVDGFYSIVELETVRNAERKIADVELMLNDSSISSLDSQSRALEDRSNKKISQQSKPKLVSILFTEPNFLSWKYEDKTKKPIGVERPEDREVFDVPQELTSALSRHVQRLRAAAKAAGRYDGQTWKVYVMGALGCLLGGVSASFE